MTSRYSKPSTKRSAAVFVLPLRGSSFCISVFWVVRACAEWRPSRKGKCAAALRPFSPVNGPFALTAATMTYIFGQMQVHPNAVVASLMPLPHMADARSAQTGALRPDRRAPCPSQPVPRPQRARGHQRGDLLVWQAAGNHHAVAGAQPFFAACLMTVADTQRRSARRATQLRGCRRSTGGPRRVGSVWPNSKPAA